MEQCLHQIPERQWYEKVGFQALVYRGPALPLGMYLFRGPGNRNLLSSRGSENQLCRTTLIMVAKTIPKHNPPSGRKGPSKLSGEIYISTIVSTSAIQKYRYRCLKIIYSKLWAWNQVDEVWLQLPSREAR
jgi:hypothetical protein